MIAVTPTAIMWYHRVISAQVEHVERGDRVEGFYFFGLMALAFIMGIGLMALGVRAIYNTVRSRTRNHR
ncbi:hypothetical protein Q0N12_10225 [Rossellomorea marisflavi]|uniref:hypothetical protein n=1 Tax=Rossellomorea marisflavi TaxID=189381 RepID=UPI00345757FB